VHDDECIAHDRDEADSCDLQHECRDEQQAVDLVAHRRHPFLKRHAALGRVGSARAAVRDERVIGDVLIPDGVENEADSVQRIDPEKLYMSQAQQRMSRASELQSADSISTLQQLLISDCCVLSQRRPAITQR